MKKLMDRVFGWPYGWFHNFSRLARWSRLDRRFGKDFRDAHDRGDRSAMIMATVRGSLNSARFFREPPQPVDGCMLVFDERRA